MSDLISRQAAIDALARAARENFNLSDEFNHYLAGLMDGETAIRQLPSAQQERKTGKWVYIRDEEGGNGLYECPICHRGDIHAHEVNVNFCWNCGAKMEGGKDE